MPETPHILTFAMPRKVKAGSAFGERLARLRAERGITQVQLAEMIGSSQRAISSYETVAEFPPAAVVVKLAHALKLSTDELLGTKASRASRSKAPIQDSEERRLWRKFRQVLALPEKDQRAIIRLINSLMGSGSNGRESPAP